MGLFFIKNRGSIKAALLSGRTGKAVARRIQDHLITPDSRAAIAEEASAKAAEKAAKAATAAAKAVAKEVEVATKAAAKKVEKEKAAASARCYAVRPRVLNLNRQLKISTSVGSVPFSVHF